MNATRDPVLLNGAIAAEAAGKNVFDEGTSACWAKVYIRIAALRLPLIFVVISAPPGTAAWMPLLGITPNTG